MEYVGNVVARIGTEYFCIYEPDSGLSIPESRRGILEDVKLLPVSVSLRRANQPVGSINFALLDRGGVVTKLLSGNDSYFIFSEVEVWYGRISGSFPFSSYSKLPRTFVTQVSHDSAKYRFSCSTLQQRLGRPLLDVSRALVFAISESSTALSFDTAGFPDAGLVRVGSEIISYDSKTATGVGSISRGTGGTAAAAASVGAAVSLAYRLDGNPITLLLQMLTSPGGGGTYDVLDFGIGLSQNLVDISNFEAVRDSFLSGASLDFYVYDRDDAASFFETEILQATNTRLVTTGGEKIELRILDQAEYNPNLVKINDGTMKFKKMSVKYADIVNRIKIVYDYDEGSGGYRKVSEYEDEDSVKAYGETTQLTYRFKGISSEAAAKIIADRYLSRFKTPNPVLDIETDSSAAELYPGDKAVVSSRFVPGNRGTLSFMETLEVLKRSLDPVKGKVSLSLAFTSYRGQRLSYISPSPVVSGAAGGVLTASPSLLEAGFKMVFSGEADIFEITATGTDSVTVSPAPPFAVAGKILSFADYDDCTENQKNFAFVGDGPFADGAVEYLIS